YQHNALRIEAKGETAGHADIDYRAVRIDARETEKVVINLLRFYDAPTAIVFCNTRDSSRHLQAMLQERGFTAALLSGELGQHERNLSIQALRDGRARVCVATDVAARGLDLPTVGLVIHADLPHDAEALQHRSGRTGRAGRKGVSVLLVPPKARRRAEILFSQANVAPDWQAPPSAEEIARLDRERMARDPALHEEPSEEEAATAAALLAEHGAEKCAAALARLLRAKLPEAEDVTDPGVGPEPFGRKDAGAKGPAGKKTPLADGVWFRLDIGRKNNADPKWMLPMLCRNGGVTRAQIGAIRIFPTDSKVEIAGEAAEAFFHNMRRPGGENIRVERLAGGGEKKPPRDPYPAKAKKHKGAKQHQ
ncbi:helicase-related protein, partial [Rhodoblastus sp.]|uniref:helicase-related protein n=1 Tax=Rhodoblastus sp. TaxID=1962975 RepID=UPI0035B3AD27